MSYGRMWGLPSAVQVSSCDTEPRCIVPGPVGATHSLLVTNPPSDPLIVADGAWQPSRPENIETPRTRVNGRRSKKQVVLVFFISPRWDCRPVSQWILFGQRLAHLGRAGKAGLGE